MNNIDIFAEKIINKLNFSNKIDTAKLNLAKANIKATYGLCHKYLDKNFLPEINSNCSNKFCARLWELVIVNLLTKNTDVKKLSHIDKGPDWEIELINGKKYFVEATSASIPTHENSEIHKFVREIQDSNRSSFGNNLLDEFKTIISSVIDAKLKKHKSLFEKPIEKGYILAVSTGALEFYGYEFKMVETVLPLGSLTIDINTSNNTMLNQYLPPQDNYLKLPINAPISTNILGNEEYNWISAILLSDTFPALLLEEAKYIPTINWGDIKNNFVLIFNPNAQYPLEQDIFLSSARLYVQNDKLLNFGKRIFPSLIN